MTYLKHRCAECGGTLKEKTITHTQAWGKERYRFENVPARVCTQCGHTWILPQVSRWIDQINRAFPKPTKHQKTRIFSL